MLAAAWRSSYWHSIRGQRARAPSCSIGAGARSPRRSRSSASIIRPGWVEHDAAEIWSTNCNARASALRQAGAHASESLRSASPISARTTVIWIAPPVLQSAMRCLAGPPPAERCQALRDQAVESRVTEKTGCCSTRTFLRQDRGLLDHVRRARARAMRGELAFARSYLADLESDRRESDPGRAATSPTSATARAPCCLISFAAWSDDLLELFNVPRAILPRVTASSEVIGKTVPELFGESIVIGGNAATSGRQHSTGVLPVGMAKNTIALARSC